MEEMNLVIAVNVPYEVEITATGIPLHEAKVEFCVHKNDVSYNFPAKMVDDKKFIFTITEALTGMSNKTHEYRLYVYYGNARFEADTGSFNLVDKKAFDVKMTGAKEEKKESLRDRLLDKTTKKPAKKVEVTPTPEPAEEEKVKVEKKVTATKPTPTPTIEPTTTLDQAKDALKKSKKITVEAVNEDGSAEDANAKVRKILSSIDKRAVPTESMSPTPTVALEPTETQQPGQFFAEIERMREINESRRRNKVVKDAIRKTTKKND
jgi:hypothetical protein